MTPSSRPSGPPGARFLLSASVACTALLGAVPAARAHISVDQGGTHKSRYSDSGLKQAPCGMTGGTRGDNVYTYKPGETITVSIVETISHPSYFRIAFDADGDDDFLTPSGTEGEFGDCLEDPACGPGKADYCNNDAVLLDHLDPHPAATGFGTQTTHTWSVTLPDVECDNCTLQIIQVMNDFNFHPDDYPKDDIYYQCIDLVLSNDAEDVADTAVENDGIDCQAGADTTVDAGSAMPADAGTATDGDTTGGATSGSQDGGAGSMAGMTTADAGGTTTAGGGTGSGTSDPADGQASSGDPQSPASGGSSAPADSNSGAKAQKSSDSGGCSATGGAPPRGLLGLLALCLLGLCMRRRAGGARTGSHLGA